MADLARIVALTRRHRWWLLGGGLLSLLTLLASVGLLSLAGWFVGAAALAGAAGAGAGFDIHRPGAGIRALAALRVLGRYGERIVAHEATFRALAAIRLWFFARAIPLAPGRLGGMRGGDLLARIVADVEFLDSLYLRLLGPGAVAALFALALILFIGWFSLPAAAAVLLLLAVAGIGVPALMHRLGDRPGRAVVAASAGLRIAAVDLLQGLAELRAYGAAARQCRRIAAADRALRAAQRRTVRLAGLSAGLTQLAGNLAALAALVLGAAGASGGAIDPPVLAMLVLCAAASFEAVAPLPLAWQLLGQTRAAARRVLEVADAPPSVCAPAGGGAALPPGHDLRLRGVCFAWPGADRPALQRVDLDLPAGARLGLIGHSGAGKSTLLALLLRFHDPDAGAIRLGGVNLRELAPEAVRSRFAVMSQRTGILAASLRDNLRLGRPDADDATLTAALRAAGAGGFLDGLPQRLDTWLGESGVLVSGGEARRIALARVYLRDAPILLLDEPTEGLDGDTEADVLERLAGIAAGRTLLMVTHRPAALALTDRVVRLAHGRLEAEPPPPSTASR